MHFSARWLPVAALLWAPAVAAQGTGVVTGQVTDESSGQPVNAAQIQVVGTTIGGITNEQGRYTLRGVPAREVTIRVLRVGFQERQLPTTVANGQTATLDIGLRAAAVTLTPVVTTVTGPQRRVEQSNSIGQIAAADIVGKQPIASVGDLLNARTPGVNVLGATTTGAAPRVRIRGNSSISLSNAPIYVIDGVRMASGTGGQQLSVGGTVASRLQDLNPEEIETVEVVKGPSAATLYGTDAANGVVVITTKKGRAGRVATNGWLEGGLVDQASKFPTAYSTWGRRPGTTTASAATSNCNLIGIANNGCVADSVTSFNLFEDPETTPYATGNRYAIGASSSGGSELARFFASAEREREVGPTQIPQFERAFYETAGFGTRSEWRRPNKYEKSNLRLNVNTSPNSRLDLGLNAGYVQVDQSLAVADNNTFGLFSHALGGPGFRRTTPGGSLTGGAVPLNGYRALTPGEMFRQANQQLTSRFMGATNGNWRPLSWLSSRANLGIDFSSVRERRLCRLNECPGNTTRLQGQADYGSVQWYTYTADVGATAQFQPLSWLNSKTTVGSQYVRVDQSRNLSQATNLPVGATTVTNGATAFANEDHTFTRTLGGYVEEQLSVRDRLFLTLGVRTDQSAAFGVDFKRVFYPKTGLSYLISDESFFPKASWLDQLRLRVTYGQAGVQPGSNDALQTVEGTSTNVDRIDRPGVFFQALGNKELKPERAAEWEAGFDGQLFGSRLTLDVTYYNKINTDQLVSRILPPSAGAGARTRRENLASVKNVGWEALVTARPVDHRLFGWDVTVNGSTNDNKVVSLGGTPTQISGLNYVREGYPLNGFFDRTYTYDDANGDGIINGTEVTLSDSVQFLGRQTPRYELALTNGFDLINRQLRVTTLFDYRGGYKVENVTEEFRCSPSSRNNCRALHDKTAPEWERARIGALTRTGGNSFAGFVEDASFVRWRELAVTYTPSNTAVARFFRTRSASITAAVRNIALFTDYTGIDPESNYGTGDIQNDFQTSPPQRYMTLRVNLGF